MQRLLILLFVCLCTALHAQNPETNYDQSLADSLGADTYGMKMYTFVILKTGSTKISDKDSLQVVMRDHLDNISRLAEAGEIVAAGPYGKNELNYRGLFIFNSADTVEVRNLLLSDHAIKIGIFDPILIPWYGSAALPMYMPYHSLVQKEKP